MNQRITWALVLSLSLAACGGGDSNPPAPPQRNVQRLVVFGDSLSDSGTYRVAVQQVLAARVNPAYINAEAGRFTDGAGPIWPEALAARLGISIRNERFEWGEASPLAAGNRVLTEADATNYSQGGARVALDPGVGCSPVAGRCSGTSSVPLLRQIDRALAKGRFGEGDLVVLWGGSNDVLANTNLAVAELTALVTAEATRLGRALTDPERQTLFATVRDKYSAIMAEAGAAAVAQAKRLREAGAQRLVLITIPNVAQTPRAVAQPQLAPFFDAFSVAFNTRFVAEINAQLNDPAAVLLFDAGRLSGVFYDSPSSVGLSNRETPVCNVPPDLGNSSLYCFKNLGAPFINAGVDASQSMFADGIHPTLAVHAKLATALYDALKDRDWVH